MPNVCLRGVVAGVLGMVSSVGCEKIEAPPQPAPEPIVVKPWLAPVPAPQPPAPAASIMPPAVLAPTVPAVEPAPQRRPVDERVDRYSSDDRVDRENWYKRRAINVRWFVALGREQRAGVKQACEFWGANPCAGALTPFTPEHPDPTIAMLASLSAHQMTGVGPYCEQLNEGRGHCNTPLVVAFDAQPIEFTATAQSFAFRAGEPAARTDFPTAATPWIALDRDGDGAITSGAELFGDATPLPGGGTAPDGYAALAALDANGDGVIDRRDPAFASLLLWTDVDGNGTSSPDELRPLARTIAEIPLAHTHTARCTARGDCEGERGSLAWRDDRGGTHRGAVVDVYLATRN